MIPKQAIEKAIEGGYGQTEKPYSTNWTGMALDPIFWQALGKVLGWQTSKYQACEMRMPFYSRETMRDTGVIVGESKDKKQWYIRWDTTTTGKPTKNGGLRQPYPKENIIEISKSENWRLVATRFTDLILADDDTEKFWAELLQ